MSTFRNVSLLYQFVPFSPHWSGSCVACTQIPCKGLAVFSVNIYFLASLEYHQHIDFVIKRIL